MKVVYHEGHRDHHPTAFLVSGSPQPSPEVPERAEVLLSSARQAGHEVVMAADGAGASIAAVHTPEYLQFLESIFGRWSQIEGASAEVIPNVHPNGRTMLDPECGYPRSAVGQAGYHMADTACPIAAGTWQGALASATSAVHAARLLRDGGDALYALCRPPGHHAFADMAGGFCYLNNAAIAAQELLSEYSRVAVLDVDLHHGNGTQGIFYRRPEVFTVSLHADPATFYPFFWGYAGERGAGEGEGANLNVPLPRGTGDGAYLEKLARTLDEIRRFAPGALVVALGLDAFEGDPLAGLSITTAGFARIAEAIASLGLPTLLVQEGGYLSDALGRNLVSFLDAFEQARG